MKINKLVPKSKFKPSTGYLDPRPRVSNMRLDIWKSDSKQDVVISEWFLIVSVFFYLVNLRIRFDKTLDRISDPKNLGQRSVGYSLNSDSSPRPDINIFGQEFQM